MKLFKRKIVDSKVEIGPTDFLRFRFDSRQTWYGNRLFLRAWVVGKHADTSLSVVVSDTKPQVTDFVMRQAAGDEHFPVSRQDTLWGDLKIAAKKMSREASHRIDHYQKNYGGEFSPARRAKIVGLPLSSLEKLEEGQRYLFELNRAAGPVELHRLRDMIAVDVSSDKGPFVSYRAIVNEDERIFGLKAKLGFGLIGFLIFTKIILGVLLSNS